MGEFHLKNIIEYRQIKYKKSIIDAIISRLNHFDKPYNEVILKILNETAGDHFIKLYYGPDYKAGESIIIRRMSIFWTLSGSNSFKAIASDINLKTEKDFNYLASIANFSFAEHIFRHNYSLYLAHGAKIEDTVEALSASELKKKAEETYKKGYIEEAIEIFKQALDLTPHDFIILFQLGMYYFFEKADHIKACDCFEKSAAGAAGIFPRLESMAYCFLSLINRLKALHDGNHSQASGAFIMCEKALAAEPDFIMAQYCRLQAIAGLCAFEDQKTNFLKEAHALFEADHNLLVQAVLDNAFDPALEQLALVASARYDSSLNRCVKMIEDVTQKFCQIPERLESSADTARVFQLSKEFKAAQEYFRKNASCAGIEETIKRVQKINEGIDFILNNNRVQMMFIKLKEYSSNIVSEYKKECGNELTLYNNALKKRDELSARIKAVYKTYFAVSGAADNDEMKNEGSGHGNYNCDNCGACEAPNECSECLEKKYTRRNQKTLDSIKSMNGFIIFSGLEFIAALLWLTAGAFTLTDFIMATTINLCLAPFYTIAGAEVFYYIISLKLDELKREFSKLELKLNLSDNLPGEVEIKVGDKYAKRLANEFNISQIEARNVIQAALACDYKKMKAAASSICAIYSNHNI